MKNLQIYTRTGRKAPLARYEVSRTLEFWIYRRGVRTNVRVSWRGVDTGYQLHFTPLLLKVTKTHVVLELTTALVSFFPEKKVMRLVFFLCDYRLETGKTHRAAE